MARAGRFRLIALLVLSGPGRMADAGEGPRYVGPAACSSNNCHGSVTRRHDSTTSLQNEYVIWYKNDRHAKAYESLLTERALRIGRLLGMVQGQATAATWLEHASRPERCLDCHALEISGERKLKRADGVSCEACHGPAGPWLTKHTERGWEPAQSIALGMRETMDPAKAAEICLGCHFGTGTRTVDHEMLAAGHPPLMFELDTFSTNMPAHWTEHPGNVRWFRGGAWAAGQAVGLREALNRLTENVRDGGWPDFSLYECSACHHDLRVPSWRQERGYAGRMPGAPPLDLSGYAVPELLARALAPAETARRLTAEVEQMARAASQRGPRRDGGSFPSDAGAAAASVIERAGSGTLDESTVRALLYGIVDAADPLAYAGFRTAQQVAWSLDALAVARLDLLRPADRETSHADSENDPLRRSIGPLFTQLRDPAAYDPARFASGLRSLRASLP